MKRLIVMMLSALSFAATARGVDKPVFTIAVRVHLITGAEFKDNGKPIDLWMTADDFNKSVLPEMNRIWKPAGVQWKVESIVTEAAKQTESFQKTMTSIEKSEMVGLNVLQPMFPRESRDAQHVNLYILPRIGGENGVAGLGGKVAVVSIWRKAGPALQHAPLVTCKPPLVSVAKTCAHELGHNLGLKHPDPPERDRLMTAGPGLDFTPAEIETARKRAAELTK